MHWMQKTKNKQTNNTCQTERELVIFLESHVLFSSQKFFTKPDLAPCFNIEIKTQFLSKDVA